MDRSRHNLLGCFSKEATNIQGATLLIYRKKEGKRMGFTLLITSHGPDALNPYDNSELGVIIPSLTDEEAEAQGGSVSCPGSHS